MRWKSCIAIVLTCSLSVAQAGDPAKLDCSLKHVPADALFYSSTMRMGEQIDAFLRSKAYAQLRALPAAKFVHQQLMSELKKPGNPGGHILEFLQAPENQELCATLLDLSRNEVFVYGGEGNIKLLNLAGTLFFTAQAAQMTQRFGGAADPTEMVRTVLDTVKESLDDVSVPEFVMGFRTNKSDGAKNALARLEGVVKQVLQQVPPELRGRFKREKIGDSEGLVVTLDGSLVPWDKINIAQYEDEKDEYKSVVDKLKSLKLAITLAVKGDYLLMTVGSDTSGVAKFGAGPSLGGVPEFAPLAKFTESKLIALSFTSKKLAELLGTSGKDIDEMVHGAKEGLGAAPISEKLREKINKDIDKLAAEWKNLIPKPAATMGFEFVTATGSEGFNYVYDEADPNARPLGSILNQLGGSPILAAVNRGADATPTYKKLVSWIKIFYGHAEEAAKELADENQFEQFKGVMAQVLPYFKRFDEITGGQLLPAFADGQTALVLDNKWTSKKWFPELDQGNTELPMFELGMIWGISDSEKLLEAFKGYRKLVNDVFGVVKAFIPGAPDEAWPQPDTAKAGAATLYFWPIPPLGQDASINPNLGISKQFLSFSLSTQHAERLHSTSSAGNMFKDMAGDKKLMSAAYFNFSELLKVARPWVEKFIVPAMLADAPDSGPDGLRKADIPAQVKTVMDVLSCLKGYREVTYRDTNATVTRHVTVVEDLK